MNKFITLLVAAASLTGCGSMAPSVAPNVSLTATARSGSSATVVFHDEPDNPRSNWGSLSARRLKSAWSVLQEQLRMAAPNWSTNLRHSGDFCAGRAQNLDPKGPYTVWIEARANGETLFADTSILFKVWSGDCKLLAEGRRPVPTFVGDRSSTSEAVWTAEGRYYGSVVAKEILNSIFVAEARIFAKAQEATLALERRLKAQPCPIATQDWVYLEGACNAGRPSGQGRAESLDGRYRFAGTFEAGSPKVGRMTAGGSLVFEGEFRNLMPLGQGLCPYRGDEEPCEMRHGQRVDELHRQRLALQEQIDAQERAVERARRELEDEIAAAQAQAEREAEREAGNRRQREAINRAIGVMTGRTTGDAAMDQTLRNIKDISGRTAQLQRQYEERQEEQRRANERVAAQQRALEARAAESRRALAEMQRQQLAQAQVAAEASRRKAEADAEAARQRQLQAQREQQEAAEARRRAADAQAAREAAAKAEVQAAAQAKTEYLDALLRGIRLRAMTCPGGKGQHFLSGTRPKLREVMACVDVAYRARCPGMSVGVSGVIRNFVGASDGCFLGDAAALPQTPSCKAEQVIVDVTDVSECR